MYNNTEYNIIRVDKTQWNRFYILKIYVDI